MSEQFDPMLAYVNSKRNGGLRVSMGGLNPTGASCIITDEKGNTKMVGKCQRQVWYSKNKVPRTNEPDDHSMLLFGVGDAVETELQEHWTKQGLTLADNLKVREVIGTDPDTGEPVYLSGEIDSLLRYFECDEHGKVMSISTDTAIGMEVKSTRGHFSAKLLLGRGNKMYPIGYPKIEHLMQTGLYLHTRKVIEEAYGVSIPYFVLVYELVDSCLTSQFRIELSNDYDGEILVKTLDGRPILPQTDPMVKLEQDIQYKPMQGLTIENIVDRFMECHEKLKKDSPPDRDYELRYSDKTFEKLTAQGDMTKTKSALFGKDINASVGDWQCSYCDWKDECYPFGVLTARVESEEVSPEDAMRELGF